jgi:hypothetical protein
MSRHRKILVCVLSGLVAGTGTRAVPNPSQHPYDKIPERNVFNLKPIPPPPPHPIEEVPLPKVTLTGITTLLGLKRAVLQAQTPARSGLPAREQSYILAEGQRDGDIEVVEIDEAAGIVKIKAGEIPMTLDFVSNGVKPPTLPVQAAPTQTVTMPQLTPSGRLPATPPSQPSQSPTLPTLQREPRVPQDLNSNLPAAPVDTSMTPRTAVPPPLNPDEQILMIEAQRAKALDEGDPAAKILPPTALTPEVTGQSP